MSVVSQIADIISNLSDEDEDTRKSARTALLTHSRKKSGVKALLAKWFGRLEDLIDAGERDEVAICMSRILRYKATHGLDDWNLGRLEACRSEFERITKEEKKKDMLQAVRYFALAYPGEASLVETAVWVQVALRCKEEYHGSALLLLDALDSLVSLPAAIHGARQTKLMLAHVFIRGEKPEKCAGVRVALRVLAYLEQGAADGSLEPGAADAWRTMLENKNIVQVVVGCINRLATEAAVERALHLLAQLSKHEVFLETLRTEEVLRVLVKDVLEMELLGTSLFAILHQVLASAKAANAFSSIGGVEGLMVLDYARLEDAVLREMISVLSLWLRHATSKGAADEFTDRDGLRICLNLLDKVDLEAAKGILALLMAWSDKATDTKWSFDGRPDMSRLVSLLISEDTAIAEPACVLVSWALHHEMGNRAVLANELKDEAISVLLPFLASPSQDARYGVRAIACLIMAHVHDEKSAGKFAEFGVHRRLLKVARDPFSDEMLGAGAGCLATLANHSRDIADELVSKGAIGVLLAHLGAEEVTAGRYDKNTRIMAAVISILEQAREAEKVDTPVIQRLLEVSRTWSISQRWLAFCAILASTHAGLDTVTDLDAPLKEECVQLTVSMLREKPHADAEVEALDFLDTILCEASASLGQTFILAGGPELLVHHVKLEDDNRDEALRAVLSIANNESLHNVMDDLVRHAGMGVAVLCDTFPPYTTEAATELRVMFWEAFKQYPQWAPTGDTTTETRS